MPSDQYNVAHSLAAYEPSWRERIGNSIYDIANSLGLSSTANRMRNDAMTAVDFIPGVGEAIGLNDAMNDFNAGNYGMAAAGLGLTAAGVVPGVGDAVANAGRKGIRAFHGSPHDFDKFSLDKIGTGEGAQAYGHGLYFAESEDVAQAYRDALRFPRVDAPRNVIEQVADDLNYHRGDVQGVESIYRGMIERGDEAAQKMGREKLDALPDAQKQYQGHMYEVRINADPDDFLDWDAPLSAQPNVLSRLGFAGMDENAIHAEAARIMEAQPRGAWMNDPASKARIDELQDMLDRRPPSGTGQDYYRGGSDGDVSNILSQMGYGNPEAQTAALRDAGIPGIKYLDQVSRGAGDGSRNFVVFDDSLIEIVKKYGLAGAVAAGLISQEMAAQMQAQGMGEI